MTKYYRVDEDDFSALVVTSVNMNLKWRKRRSNPPFFF